MDYKDRLVKRLATNWLVYIFLFVMWFIYGVFVLMVTTELPLWKHTLISTILSVIISALIILLDNLRPIDETCSWGCPETEPVCANGVCVKCDSVNKCTGKTPICLNGVCIKCDSNNKCPEEAPNCNIDGSCNLST